MKSLNPVKIAHIKAKFVSVVWRSAQRPFDEKHADYLAEHFDPELLDPLSVTKADEHGMHHVIRGQHRLAAFKKVFGEEQMVPCIVVDANDEVVAAELFLVDAESHKPLKAVEEFMVAVTAGRPDEVAINRIVQKAGFRIGTSRQPDIIMAVHALSDVYAKHGGAVLGQTLRALHSTWGSDHNAVQSGMIRGYGEFLALYGNQINAEILHLCMTKRRWTPGRLLNSARHEVSMRKDVVKNLAGAMAVAIFGIYNASAGRKKLHAVSAPSKNNATEVAKAAVSK